MLDIEYKGGNTVVVTTKSGVVVTDPKQSLIGLKDIETKDAIELSTEARFAVNSELNKVAISGPGDYGVSNFDIHGLPAQRHLDSEDDGQASTIYRLESGDVRICVVGNIYEKLTDDQLEDIGVIDILIIPVGGNGYTLDAIGAANLTRKIDPRVVIPVHYADKALKYEVEQADVSEFVKELGAPVEKSPKYKIKSTSSLPTSLTIVQLDRA